MQPEDVLQPGKSNENDLVVKKLSEVEGQKSFGEERRGKFKKITSQWPTREKP